MNLRTVYGAEIDAPELLEGRLPNSISPGVYVIVIELKNGAIQTKKIIVK